jgi:sugar phosphate isomerase/epimerase
MKFAICQELFEGWDWERQCRFISEVGYTGIEVAPFTLARHPGEVSLQQRKDLRQTAESCGLQVIGLHWLLAKTQGLHLTSSDSSVRNSTAEYLMSLGDLCADLGGTIMVFGSPQQRNLPTGVSREAGMEHAADVFRQSLPHIAGRGVTICLEPLTPKETNFINTCADAAELIARVNHPNFALHQDVKAMLSESESIPVLIVRYRAATRHFHVNDSNLLGPGMGATDYAPIFRALVDSGYDGWVSVEVFDYAPGAEHIARASLKYMRDVLARAGAGAQA